MDKRKMANNILELMIDPTVVPVEKRLYFGPEEKLDNRSYEKAKSESFLAYRHQRQNSDMYPTRNRKLTRMGGFSMDRKAMIASLDILAQKFSSNEDPIAKDLRAMAQVMAEMPEEEFGSRITAEEAPEETPAEEKTANAWMDAMAEARKKNPGKSFKEIAEAAKKIYKKEATDEEMKQAEEMFAEETSSEEQTPVTDTWSEKAAAAVQAAILEDVVGTSVEAGKKKGPGKPDGTGPWGGTEKCPMTKKEEDKEASEEKVEETKEAMKEKVEEAPEKKVEETEAPEKKVEETKEASEEKPAEDKTAEEDKVVNTDILAKEKFAGIELTNGMVDAEDVGELSAEEKSRLDLLFQQ